MKKVKNEVQESPVQEMDEFQNMPAPSNFKLENGTVLETLSDADKAAFEVAGLKQKLALKEAEKALSQNENAELSFKYFLLQLYVKYQLDTAVDAIGNDGRILRGALLNQGQK